MEVDGDSDIELSLSTYSSPPTPTSPTTTSYASISGNTHNQNNNESSTNSSYSTFNAFKFDSLSLQSVVRPSLSLTHGKSIYTMAARPRGFCLIINNVDFIDPSYPRRSGSDQESNRLTDVFFQLYFHVIQRRNLGYSEMLATLNAIASHPDLSRHDALCVIILSHGSSGKIKRNNIIPI
jgi:hypothetical protein